MKQQAQLHVNVFLDLFFDPEDGGDFRQATQHYIPQQRILQLE
jgi:hypothetical protein